MVDDDVVNVGDVEHGVVVDGINVVGFVGVDDIVDVDVDV